MDNGHRRTLRLNPLLESALKLYMSDRHLDNRSEVLKSALGQFLEREGYLMRDGGGIYQATTPAEWLHKKSLVPLPEQLIHQFEEIVRVAGNVRKE